MGAHVIGAIYRQRWQIEEYQPDYESSARFYQLAA